MKNFILLPKRGKVAKSKLGLFLFLFTLLIMSNVAYGQCSLAANDVEQITVDENCQATISVDVILEDPGTTCDPSTLTVYIYDGPNFVASGNPAILPAGYVGQTLDGYVHDATSNNYSEICLLEIHDGMAPTLDCFQALGNRRGSLLDGAPTYNRPADGSGNGFPCTLAGPPSDNVRYDVLEFTVSEVDDYAFDFNQLTPPYTFGGFFVAVYHTSFDPLAPCTNLVGTVAGMDPDFGFGTLYPGQVYYIVTSTYYNFDMGRFDYIFTPYTGEGDVWALVPDCNFDVYCYEDMDEVVIIDPTDNCDNDVSVAVVSQEPIEDNDCVSGLDDDIFSIINRVYQGTDASGNQSDLLDVTITIRKMPFDLFVSSATWPDNLLVTDGNALECDEVNSTNSNTLGYPYPSLTGAPGLEIYGQSISLLSPYLPCNITATYIDLPFNPDDSCVKRFMRIWTVSEWSCQNFNNALFPYYQIIEIADTTPPTFDCPASVALTTDVDADFGDTNCGANYTFPTPLNMDDNCNPSTLTWGINVYDKNDVPIGSFSTDLSTLFANPQMVLPQGINTIEYILTDICGYSSTCEFTVTVTDNTAPTMVCQTFTTVALTHDGEAEVFAHSFDSGTWDDCELDRLVVRRDDQDPNTYYDYVTFDCNDVLQNPMVWLRAYDKNNNWDECMVSVTVQDKLNPTIVAPDDQIVDCEFFYEPTDLTTYFGWPTAYDNCFYTITQDSITEEFECWGETVDGIPNVVKKITRTFVATDNGLRTATDEQLIYFTRQNFFGFVNGVTTDDANGEITWPINVTYTDCMGSDPATNPLLHPDATGWPLHNELNCDQIAHTYSDFVFVDNDNDLDNNESCFKIIRTWTVLNNCHRLEGKFVRWTYDQTIFVNNSVDPTMSMTPDSTVCTYDEDCIDGYIDLVFEAEDDCTADEDLRWRYHIDYDNDNPVGIWDDSSPIYSGNILDASGDYDIGTHRLLWIVWDQCGNKVEQEQLITIMNCKQPTPVAQALETDIGIMGNGTFVMIPIELHNKGSYHTCDYPLTYSYDEAGLVTVATYFCPDTAGLVEVEFWVTAHLPDGSVTKDMVFTTIDVQDNFDSCPGPLPGAIVSGFVTNEYNEAVSGVQVALEGSEFIDQATDEDGLYAFPEMQTGGSYKVKPALDENHNNGVSTLDLIHVQKHLLGLKAIDSPYKMIAADVNHDEKISASDLLNARELILGVTDVFENNTSWRFIQANYEFENEANPLTETYPEFRNIENIEEDIHAGFIAIKVGDITNDASLNGLPVVEGRNSQTLAFDVDAVDFADAAVVEVPVYANNFTQINGFQFTLDFNEQLLNFDGLESGTLNLSTANYNFVADGKVTVSWSQAIAIDVADDTELFTINFVAQENGNLVEALGLNSALTKAEAYNANLDKMNIDLNFRNLDAQGDYALYQNMPNPFSDYTLIRFFMKDTGSAAITIYDMNGRVIKVYDGNFAKGENEITVSKEDLPANGLMYYQMNTEEFSATKKMILLK